MGGANVPPTRSSPPLPVYTTPEAEDQAKFNTIENCLQNCCHSTTAHRLCADAFAGLMISTRTCSLLLLLAAVLLSACTAFTGTLPVKASAGPCAAQRNNNVHVARASRKEQGGAEVKVEHEVWRYDTSRYYTGIIFSSIYDTMYPVSSCYVNIVVYTRHVIRKT